jgi:hypothetical protein
MSRRPVRYARPAGSNSRKGADAMVESLSVAERFEIERACERLIFTYVRLLDIGNLGAAADCFAAEGSLRRPLAPDQVIQGRETIRTSLLARPRELLTKHLATNIMIEVDSRDRAHGLSYLTMISTTPPAGAAPPFPSQGPIWFGEFEDWFILEEGAWKFLERRGSVQMKFAAAPAPQT